MKILALTKYGPLAASTRQRILLYQPALERAGFSLDVHPLLGDSYVRRLVDGTRENPIAIARSYLDRLGRLLSLWQYDLVWIYAEAFPYFPGAFERLPGWTGIPVVVDWDDAFFHAYDQSRKPLVRMLLGRKMQPLLRSATAVVCGNRYLADYATRWANDVTIIPTVVDTRAYVPLERARNEEPVTIGWIGSPSTWRYVRPFLPLLEELARTGRARFHAMGAGIAAAGDTFTGMRHIEWTAEREIDEIQAMDIGIMPLVDEPFERGKCGYKLIQYMACGLPVVASPVGVNRSIVTDETGYLAEDQARWRHALDRLIGDPALRARLGAAGRRRAMASYSLEATASQLVALFERLVSPL